MAHTSRAEAREVECPSCAAPAGQKCLGVRGKRRESVHRERMRAAAVALGHPEIVTLTLDGERLVDAEGSTVGRLTHVEIDLQVEGEAGNLRRGVGDGVVDVDVDTASQTQAVPLSQGCAEGDNSAKPQGELLPDPVEETWALYAELLERPRAVLTPKVRRWINDAHKAAGVEETRQAIRGLAASDYHRQNGYVDIGYAIVAKRGETVEGRIEMMASKAGTPGNRMTTVQALIARLPSEAQSMVRQWISDVEAMLRNPDHPGLAATGQSRLNDLRSKAQIEPIIEDGRITDWKDVRR